MNKEIKNDKQRTVYRYIQKNEPVDQPTITREFHKEFDYKHLTSARSAISRILQQLEMKGLITKTTRLNDTTGSIDVNVWQTKKQ